MITPLHNFVVVKELKEKIETTIILPSDADTRPSSINEVVAVSPTGKLGLKPGDKVMIQPYGFDEIEVDGQKVKIGKEDNILAKC